MDQQKILGYFIEEAKEHLETLERGILDLSAVIEDQERVNEMFRAAHSVKGGAAMLGYSSIQKVAHRLEDAFKVLKENRVGVDQKLESFFLRGYDVLQDLVEKLQGPFGLQQDEAESIVEGADQNFVELQNYLGYLLSHETSVDAKSTQSANFASPADSFDPDIDISAQIKTLLKNMLKVFNQEATGENRQKLQDICAELVGFAPQLDTWQNLLKTAQAAIANHRHSFHTLAPVIIKELKQGSDYLELEQGHKITTGQGLQHLANAQIPQLLIPAEPGAMANILLQVFSQQQVGQLVQLLSQHP